MDRTMITRTLSVEEVPASGTRARLCTLIMHPEAQLVSIRERRGQTILTLQWTPAEEED